MRNDQDLNEIRSIIARHKAWDLIFMIVGVFVLRAKRPHAERPYRAFGYPVVPLLYIATALTILFVLLFYRTETAGWSLVIVLLGLPVYWLWSRQNKTAA